MDERAYRVGASIWGFFSRRRPETWPTLGKAATSILSLDESLGVEVWASREREEPEATGANFDDLVRACRSAAFVSVHTRGLFWHWDPKKLRHEIEFARTVGGETLVIHPVCLGLKRPGERIDVDEVQRIAVFGRARGVRLALENVRDSIWSLDHVLDALGTDPEESNLGICIDVGHAHLSADTEPHADGAAAVSTYLRRYAQSLIHLHLHDNHGERDEHLAFGEGTIEWDRTLGTIEEIGFDGTAVLEIHGSEDDPTDAIKRSLDVIRRRA